MNKSELRARLKPLHDTMSSIIMDIAKSPSADVALRLMSDVCDEAFELHATSVANTMILMTKCASDPRINEEAQAGLNRSIKLLLPKAKVAFDGRVRAKFAEGCEVNNLRNPLDDDVNAATRDEIMKMIDDQNED